MLKFSRSVLRLAKIQQLKPLTCMFSNQVNQSNFVSLQSLAKKLDNEVQYEKANYRPDEEIDKFIQENRIEIIDEKENGYIMEMKRPTVDKNKTLYIRFYAKNPELDKNETKQTEEKEEPQEQPVFVEFLAAVVNNVDYSALVFECASFDDEIHVNNVAFTPDYSKFEKDYEQYDRDGFSGPDFSSLDDSLQKNLLDYLKEHGVDENLLMFIESYSIEKEYRLYLDWLQSCSKHAANSQ